LRGEGRSFDIRISDESTPSVTFLTIHQTNQRSPFYPPLIVSNKLLTDFPRDIYSRNMRSDDHILQAPELALLGKRFVFKDVENGLDPLRLEDLQKSFFVDRLSAKATGPGLPPNLAPLIFEIF
jgi:hypothetical protein